MLWILTSLVVIGAVYYYLIKPRNYWTKLGVKQKKPAILFGDLVGTVLKTQSFTSVIEGAYNQFPGARYSGFFQFTKPVLLLRDPELIKQITVKDFDHFVDHRQFVSEEADPLFGKNLISLKGQKWRQMRATLSPCFTSSKMKYMFELLVESGEHFTNYFKDANNDKISLEMKDIFSRYTSDVIASIAFGIKIDSLRNKDNEFYLMGKKAMNFTIWKSLKFFGFILVPKLYEIFKISLFGHDISEFFRNLIKDTIHVREENNIVRPDMLHLLLEARKGIKKVEDIDTLDMGFAIVEESEIGKGGIQNILGDDDIVAQAMIFFFAGFDSVAALMCFTAYELGVNQNVQDRLRNEIEHTLNECNGKITYEHILKIKYLDMVISETLRKWPNGILMDRICTKPYTIEPREPDEVAVHLKINDTVFIPIIGIHRDPQYYPDPEKFDPERFNDKNKVNIKPCTYFPFGSGPRNCIGSRFALLETKVLIFSILRCFKIVPCEKTVIPLVISKETFKLTAKDGFWFNFERIHN